MAKQTINVGTTANDNTGDTLRVSFTKVNANFTELYTNVATGSSDRLINGANQLILGTDGTTTFPTLTVPISDNANPSGTGQTLKFSDASQQAIIYGPASTVNYNSAERIIIQGAPGYTGTSGEGGDVYLWAGPGGNVDGGGGDIKVRAGQGSGSGQGGYLNFQAGDTGTGYGGYINIESGSSGTVNQGGYIRLNASSGGDIDLLTSQAGIIALHTNNNSYNFTFDANGTLSISHPSQVDNAPSIKLGDATSISTNNLGFAVPASLTGVVYVSRSTNLLSMKLLITIQGLEDGGDGNFHTQVCEMLVVRRTGATINTVNSVVYGVTYTSVGPLATLTAQEDTLSGRINILATPTNSTGIGVKVYATEVINTNNI